MSLGMQISLKWRPLREHEYELWGMRIPYSKNILFQCADDLEVVRPCQYLQLNAFLGENASPSKWFQQTR